MSLAPSPTSSAASSAQEDTLIYDALNSFSGDELKRAAYALARAYRTQRRTIAKLTGENEALASELWQVKLDLQQIELLVDALPAERSRLSRQPQIAPEYGHGERRRRLARV